MAQVQEPTEIFPGITVDPRIVHGVPVIAGTRIPAKIIVGHLAAGDSVERVAEAYVLTQEQVRAALAYAASRLDAEATVVIASV